MKLKFSINEIIYIISFYGMAFCTLFLRWYNNSSAIRCFGCFSLLLLAIINYKKTPFSKKEILIGITYFIYLLINITFTSNHSNIIKEVISFTFLPLSIVLCFRYFTTNHERFKKLILNPCFIIFNLYYIINLFITIKQFNNSNFLVHNFTGNTFYTDQICGLLGNNGTHRLAFFTLVCIYINYLYFNSPKKIIRYISKTMFTFIIISSIYVSAYNDNRMYYLLLAMFLIPIFCKYIFKKHNNKICFNKKNLIKFFSYSVTILLFSGLIYAVNSDFRTLLNEKIIDKYIVKTFNNFNNSSTNSSSGGGEERIELFKYALKNGNGYFLGKGLGAVKLFDDPNMPKHFGLCEFTSRIYNGGLIYVFILISITYIVLTGCFKNLSKLNKLFIFMAIIIFAMYARIFTMYEETYLISVLFIIYGYCFDNKEQKPIQDEVRSC